MNRQDIKQFVREIAGRNVAFRDYEKWVSFSCVLAPWTHATGRDSSASAGISISNGASFYNCYACKTKGPVSHMLRQMEKYTGRSFGSLMSEVENNEFLGGSFGSWGGETEEGVLNEPLDKELYFDLYERAVSVPVAARYLQRRGISREATEKLNLLFDSADSEGDARILFPVCSPDGALHGFTGRAIYGGAKLRVRDYHGLKKKLLLLGSHLLQGPSFVILVEGLFDLARLVSLGFPAVASMKSDLSPEQAVILRSYSCPVYVFYDDDEAGQKGRASVKEHLCKHVPVFKVRYPTERRIFDAETGEYRPPNDPGELLAREVKSMMDDARLV